MSFQSPVHHRRQPLRQRMFRVNEATSFYDNRIPQGSLLPDCPYRQTQEQLQLPVRDDRPFYRIIRRRSKDLRSSLAMKDTYEGKTMIDATQLRPCAHNCLCRTFRCPCTANTNTNPLVFIVTTLDAHQTRIFIRSNGLLHSLFELGITLFGRWVFNSELLIKASAIQNGSKFKSEQSIDGRIDNDANELKLLADYLFTSGIATSTAREHRFPRQRENSRFDQDIDALYGSFGMPLPMFMGSLPQGHWVPCFCLSTTILGSHEMDLICSVTLEEEKAVCGLLDSTGNGFNRRVFNLNAIVDRSTALNEAIRTGNQRIINFLISAGADVNTIAPYGTPLSIATEMRSEDSMRLLLEQGADPGLAMIFLKSCGNSPGQSHISFLISIVDQCKEAARKTKITELHHNFREEYRRISRAALDVSLDSCGNWRTISQRNALLEWKKEIEKSAGGAWRTGLVMLRKLCNGSLPQNVSEVIMGIALARSMATILGKEIDKGILHDLNEDLSRWQVLFTDDARFAFANAVRRIWDVYLTNSFRRRWWVVEEIFEEFQEMVEQLMEKAHDVLGLNEQMRPSDSDWGRDGGSGKDTDRIRHDQDSRLGEHLPDEQQYLFDGEPGRTTLIWLMAGVVFACLIAVLLVLHATQINTDVLAKCYDSIRRSAFFVSVSCFLEHEQQLPDVRNGFIGYEVRESISHGTILSVDALERFIGVWCHTWEIGESERKRLSRKCDDLRNRTQMHIAQSAIELYLHYTSSDTVRSSSNENSSEAEQALKATSSADTEMTSFQFSSSRPSEEQHTPSLARETLLQSDLDNSAATSRVNSSYRASGRKLYACDICSHLFSRSNLNKHMRDKHNSKGRKPHKCTVCGRGFQRDDNRRHHEEKKHGLRFEDRRKQRRRSD